MGTGRMLVLVFFVGVFVFLIDFYIICPTAMYSSNKGRFTPTSPKNDSVGRKMWKTNHIVEPFVQCSQEVLWVATWYPATTQFPISNLLKGWTTWWYVLFYFNKCIISTYIQVFCCGQCSLAVDIYILILLQINNVIFRSMSIPILISIIFDLLSIHRNLLEGNILLRFKRKTLSSSMLLMFLFFVPFVFLIF